MCGAAHRVRLSGKGIECWQRQSGRGKIQKLERKEISVNSCSRIEILLVLCWEIIIVLAFPLHNTVAFYRRRQEVLEVRL